MPDLYEIVEADEVAGHADLGVGDRQQDAVDERIGDEQRRAGSTVGSIRQVASQRSSSSSRVIGPRCGLRDILQARDGNFDCRHERFLPVKPQGSRAAADLPKFVGTTAMPHKRNAPRRPQFSPAMRSHCRVLLSASARRPILRPRAWSKAGGQRGCRDEPARRVAARTDGGVRRSAGALARVAWPNFAELSQH